MLEEGGGGCWEGVCGTGVRVPADDGVFPTAYIQNAGEYNREMTRSGDLRYLRVVENGKVCGFRGGGGGCSLLCGCVCGRLIGRGGR